MFVLNIIITDASLFSRYIMLCGYPPFYGQCGSDCGWERGEMCSACQEMLFTSIQGGFYEFPEAEWSCVSEEAKDLIRHLLVREPSKRYSAAEVLKHLWIVDPPAATPLATPRILTRYVDLFTLYIFSSSFYIKKICLNDFDSEIIPFLWSSKGWLSLSLAGTTAQKIWSHLRRLLFP